ncbi:MAG: sulfite oxidase-like oxidoreductase [Candidatus Rokuibacteriota bacterium]
MSEARDRVPPGQVLTTKWPVLTYGETPRVDTAGWVFRISGDVETPRQWTWEELLALPQVEVVSDVHCVTKWSRLDNRWRGVRPRDLLAEARPQPDARHVMVRAEADYTTNLPLEALLDDDVVLALAHDGAPLTAEHGGPVRLVVPRLYFWKSAKWVTGFELSREDRPGFWEALGYHMHGDPWREERFGGRVEQTMQSARARKARGE